MALLLHRPESEAQRNLKREGGRPMDLLPNKRFFRPDEVAQLLALSRRTIYRMIRDGRLPGVRWGGGPWRISREILLNLLPTRR